MKVYLAGKITGDPGYKEKFGKAAEDLEKRGYSVLNPAVLPEGMEPKDYISVCLQMLFAADQAAFLPDWPTSAGACLEHQMCRYIGLPVVYLRGNDGL